MQNNLIWVDALKSTGHRPNLMVTHYVGLTRIFGETVRQNYLEVVAKLL